MFAACVLVHGAGGDAGMDGVCGVAVEVQAGAADAWFFPVVWCVSLFVLVHSVGRVGCLPGWGNNEVRGVCRGVGGDGMG